MILQNETRRVYDGMDVVQERDAMNNVIASYTRTGNIGGILARTTSAGSVFYGYDGGGNVTTLTNNAGAQVGSYTYDAFGNIVATSGGTANENPYRFSTKESFGGLYSYGLRFYSPGLGRWINRDPIGEEGGTNLYGFVGNDPVGKVDRYGLDIDDYVESWSGQDVDGDGDVAGRSESNSTTPASAMGPSGLGAGGGMPALPPGPSRPLALPAAPPRVLVTPPPANRVFVCPSGIGRGTSPVVAPRGSTVTPANNPLGTIITRPDGSFMRIMPAARPGGASGNSPGYPNGYFRISNAAGQNLDITGHAGNARSNATSHFGFPFSLNGTGFPTGLRAVTRNWF